MNDRRKPQAERAAGDSMYVHSVQKRNFQSKPFPESTVFTLLPPRPRSDGDTVLSSRGSKLLSLQVQGFCCPLQQRPSSGTVTPPSREGGEGSLTMLSSLRGRLESRGNPSLRSSTGSRPKRTPEGGPPTVCHPREPVSKTAETPTTPCDKKRQACHPGAAKVSELHLYLPSSICDNEEQDAEMRTPAEETSAPESEVNPNNANHLPFTHPSHNRQDQPNAGPGTPSDSTAEMSSC